MASAPTAIETDALIVGAGPAGLFQAFELGLLEVGCHLVDALPHAGGQCIELYPDKPIYDIPALQATTGRALVARLLAQLAPFQPQLHLGQEVSALQRQPDGRFLVATSTGTHFLAKAIVIAAGVGAFQPRRLKLEGIERFEGTQLLYRAPEDPAAFAGQRLLVLGGDEDAVDRAIRFAGTAASVLLVHRRDVFNAEPEQLERLQALREAGRIRVVAGQPTGFDTTGAPAPERLSALQLLAPDESTQHAPLDVLLVSQGLSPKLGPVADWGLALERKQLVVDTASFATSEPGIFAVGDINTYRGKKKLIVSAFHEAALAAFGVADHLHPERKTPLQYTTTSPRLHQLLGVARKDG